MLIQNTGYRTTVAQKPMKRDIFDIKLKHQVPKFNDKLSRRLISDNGTKTELGMIYYEPW